MTTHSVDNRRRSVSGASALISRRFTRNINVPPDTSKSEMITKRAASVAKAHVRIVPSIDDPSRCIIFDIVDRELEVGAVIKIGRYSDRHANTPNCMSFKSKVVSRCHCEIFVDGNDGKIYLRDTKSSSGTFLNHIRLSPAGSESRPTEICDGDIVQLGVDFQGGKEEVYRSVKMKFELNRNSNSRPLSYNLNAFQNIRTLTQQSKDECSSSHLDECCICLYAMSPFQALFISPCSHTYHFKCIRPLLQSYPGFQCPICRQYSDLEANVATEEEEELQEQGRALSSACLSSGHTSSMPSHDSLPRVETVTRMTESEESEETSQPLTNRDIMVPSSSSDQADTHPSHVVTSTPLTEPLNRSSTTTHEQMEATHDENVIVPVTPRERNGRSINREKRSSQFMEKIKMVFFEKRKSQQDQPRSRPKKHQRRPLSYPNQIIIDQQEIPPLPSLPSTSSHTQHAPLSQTLSRQSTTNAERLNMMMIVES
ncbi:hypothetical protein BD560DRAFT_388984 [Blakeslea trispora]|nr:hypothetical protein BD560DRAFT_388984 [Blakeslea trispora]